MTSPSLIYPGGGLVTEPVPGSPTDPGAVHIQDASSLQQASVALLHTADNTVPPVGGSLLTAGVAQLKNIIGNLDNQREIAGDGVPALGIATGAASFAMAFFTTHPAALGISANTVFTPAAMSGSYQGVSWAIQPGCVVQVDTGVNLESVFVLATSSTTFTAATTRTHTAGCVLNGFVFNVERDASGELDGANGAGTAVAVEYEYNGGHPNGFNNYDRERNNQGKGIANVTFSTAPVAGNTTLLVSTIPTGLFPGAAVLLTGAATPETVYVRRDYVTGSPTIPLTSALINSGQTAMYYDVYSALGPNSNPMTPFGLGMEIACHWDPATSRYYALTGTAGVIKTSSAAPAPSTVYTITGSATGTATSPNISTTTVGTVTVDINLTAIVGGTAGTITYFIDRLGADGIWYRMYTSSAFTAPGVISTTLGPGNVVNTMLTTALRYGIIFGGTVVPTSANFSISFVGR